MWWTMTKYWNILINDIFFTMVINGKILDYWYFTVVIIDKILDCCNKRHTFLMWWSIENTILLQSMTYFWLWWSMAKYETSMIYYLTVVVNDKILELECGNYIILDYYRIQDFADQWHFIVLIWLWYWTV